MTSCKYNFIFILSHRHYPLILNLGWKKQLPSTAWKMENRHLANQSTSCNSKRSNLLDLLCCLWWETKVKNKPHIQFAWFDYSECYSLKPHKAICIEGKTGVLQLRFGVALCHKFVTNHPVLRVANAFSNPLFQVTTIPLNCSPNIWHINCSHDLVSPANLTREIIPSYCLNY